MANIDLLKAILERGFSAGDLSVADELCSPDLVEHEYLVPPHLAGADILKHQISSARDEIADLAVEICDWIESGDTVWARSIARGRDPGSGREVAIDVVDICRFDGGRLVEHWGVPDRFALLHQTGKLASRS
jgi:ketosteroid isomerase-like protein